MEEDAINILKYMASNGLVANPKKTTLLFLNLKKKKDGPIIINIGKEQITQVQSAKLLGMKMEDNQEWKEHIKGAGGIIPSLNKRLYMMKRLRNHLSETCIKKVAESILCPK